jgi:hypothetical protein
MFRLLGLHPGPDIALYAAASLAAVPPGPVRALLTELTSAHLLAEHAPGRYACHDLLRAYASELAHARDGQDAQNAAAGRVLDHYLHSAHNAAVLMERINYPITMGPPPPGVAAGEQATAEEAMAWFTAEQATLLAAVQLAARTGPSARARQLAWALTIFLLRRGLWHDQTTACQAALDAARRAGDMTGEAHSLERLAAGYAKSGRIAQCQPLFEEALRLLEALGDHASQAHIHRALLWIAGRQQRPVEMLSHVQRCCDLYRRADQRTGQAMASRPSAMRTPCSPTTARPSPISNDPWPRCRRWGNGPGRVPSGTASATSITIAVTSGKPSHATNGPSASPGSSPTVSTRPTH